MSAAAHTHIEGSLPDLIKSIFPAFAVNVPMPRDTAVPGSYTQPPTGAGQPPAK